MCWDVAGDTAGNVGAESVECQSRAVLCVGTVKPFEKEDDIKWYKRQLNLGQCGRCIRVYCESRWICDMNLKLNKGGGSGNRMEGVESGYFWTSEDSLPKKNPKTKECAAFEGRLRSRKRSYSRARVNVLRQPRVQKGVLFIWLVYSFTNLFIHSLCIHQTLTVGLHCIGKNVSRDIVPFFPVYWQ